VTAQHASKKTRLRQTVCLTDKISISGQTGDSIKTLETDYAKYIKEVDSRRDFVEKQNQKVQPK
jgi:hypothetical protein